MVRTRRHIQAGSFGVSISTKIPQIADGLSNTFLIGERATRYPTPGVPGQLTDSAASLAFVAMGSNSQNSDICGGLQNCGLTDAGGTANVAPNSSNSGAGGFSSLHPGGAQMAMGDGRVVFVSENMDSRVFAWLGAIGDGNAVKTP